MKVLLHIHTPIYQYSCMPACLRTSIYKYIPMHIHTCVHTLYILSDWNVASSWQYYHACINAYRHKHVPIHASLHMYIHTNIHAYIHTHIHTLHILHINVCVCVIYVNHNSYNVITLISTKIHYSMNHNEN